jgi:hypothetical protein
MRFSRAAHGRQKPPPIARPALQLLGANRLIRHQMARRETLRR